MATFQPGAGLNERMAAEVGAPAARHLAELLADRIRVNAPSVKTWITVQDERVRVTHRHADGQTVPANLRYLLEHPSGNNWDEPDGSHELARAPRDPNLSLGNRLYCRCISADLVGVIASRVRRGEPLITGTSATVEVSVEFPRIVESEHPGSGDSGGGWAARSIEEVRASAGH